MEKKLFERWLNLSLWEETTRSEDLATRKSYSRRRIEMQQHMHAEFTARGHFRSPKTFGVHWVMSILHWKSIVVTLLVWCLGQAQWNPISPSSIGCWGIHIWSHEETSPWNLFYMANNKEPWSVSQLSYYPFMERKEVPQGLRHFIVEETTTNNNDSF